METKTIVKKRPKTAKTTAKTTRRAKLVPGKPLEQIRLDALRQLREMGIVL